MQLSNTIRRRLLFAPLAQHSGRSLLAVVAIALGVALGYAVQLINQVAVNEFTQAVGALSGDADLEVSGPRAGFDEALYARLARLPEVTVASPVLELDVRVAGRREALKVLGLDVFRAGLVQPELVLSESADGIDFLRCTRDHHSVALGRIAGPGLHHMAFELADFDGLMGASGRLQMNGYPVEWGVGRHAGPGGNIFSFFVDPNGFAAEYTTEMEQVDDATYPHRTAEDWRNVPIRPCSWGVALKRSDKLLRARTGKIVDEFNQSCTEIISRKLAS